MAASSVSALSPTAPPFVPAPLPPTLLYSTPPHPQPPVPIPPECLYPPPSPPAACTVPLCGAVCWEAHSPAMMIYISAWLLRLRAPMVPVQPLAWLRTPRPHPAAACCSLPQQPPAPLGRCSISEIMVDDGEQKTPTEKRDDESPKEDVAEGTSPQSVLTAWRAEPTSPSPPKPTRRAARRLMIRRAALSQRRRRRGPQPATRQAAYTPSSLRRNTPPRQREALPPSSVAGKAPARQREALPPRPSSGGGAARGRNRRPVLAYDPRSNVTSLMIRNIPNRFSKRRLLTILDQHCAIENEKLLSSSFKGAVQKSEYDFFYVPVDFWTGYNKGYAFVNMTTPTGARRLHAHLHGHRWEPAGSPKQCDVSQAQVQGLDALVKHFSGSIFPCGDKYWLLPARFEPPRDGVRWTSEHVIGHLA